MAIVIADKDTVITNVNPEFTKILSYDAREATGKTIRELIIPEVALRESGNARRKIEPGESIEYETLRRHKDGRLIPVLCRTSPIIVDGANVGGFSFYTDISKQKKEQVDLIHSGKRSANDQLTVINDILGFSKIEAGELEIEIINFNLRNAIEEVVELPGMMAHDKGLGFTFDIHHEVPALLRGDPGCLRQIILKWMKILTISIFSLPIWGHGVATVIRQHQGRWRWR